MEGTSWTARDRTLVEYYWLKGLDTSFIASTVDRTPKAVAGIIRELKSGRAPKRKRLILKRRPQNYFHHYQPEAQA